MYSRGEEGLVYSKKPRFFEEWLFHLCEYVLFNDCEDDAAEAADELLTVLVALWFMVWLSCKMRPEVRQNSRPLTVRCGAYLLGGILLLKLRAVQLEKMRNLRLSSNSSEREKLATGRRLGAKTTKGRNKPEAKRGHSSRSFLGLPLQVQAPTESAGGVAGRVDA